MDYSQRKAAIAAKKQADSRTSIEQAKSAAWKPTPVAPESNLDREIRRLEEAKETRRLMKMEPDARRLETLRMMRDREDIIQDQPRPRAKKVEELGEASLADPERTYAEFEFIQQVLEQHQPGMDESVADAMWKELQSRETAYIAQKRAARVERVAALQAELKSLDAQFANVQDAPRPNAFGFLHRAIPTYGHEYGVTLTPQEYREIDAAAGNPEAEQAVAQKFAEKINQYVTAVEAEGAAE